jgi:hypothetical protein
MSLIQGFSYLQAQVFALVNNARERLAGLTQLVETAMSSTNLSIEGRHAAVADELERGRPIILGLLEEARAAVVLGHGEVDRQLADLARVDPDELDTLARSFGPTLTWAAGNPQRLINIYRQRHLEPAYRVLLEQTAQGVIDGYGDEDNFTFRDNWRAIEAELALGRSPEEQQALADRASLAALSGYLDSVARVIGFDLAALDPSVTLDETAPVGRAMAEAEVNRYESAAAEPATLTQFN